MLVSQNHLTRCMNEVGTKSMEAIASCINKLEQKAPLDRLNTESNAVLSDNDNVIVKIGREDLNGVTYETALKERFVGHGQMTLAQMPLKIELEKKDYKHDESGKICFFEPYKASPRQGERVCYVNQIDILQQLEAYRNMASADTQSSEKIQDPSSVDNKIPEKVEAEKAAANEVKDSAHPQAQPNQSLKDNREEL